MARPAAATAVATSAGARSLTDDSSTSMTAM